MRTKYLIRNIISVILLNLIISILGFVKIKVFINSLSVDLYSLNQLFNQIFGYLMIAYLGVGVVFSKNLYNAFSKNDKEKIKSIYVTSKKFFNFVGVMILLFSLGLAFFVQIFTKAEVDLSYMRILFLIIMLLNVLEYFYEAPRMVISADQKQYMIEYYVKGVKIFTSFLQIVLVILKVDFILVMLCSFLISVLFNLLINKKIYKLYPYLKDDMNIKFDKEHLKGVGNLIPTKISGLINSNTDIILISTFISPLAVTIYSAYYYIVKYLSDTMYLVSSAIVPSYANVINLDDEKKSFKIYKEIDMLFIFLGTFVSIMLYGFLDKLIEFWIGKSYLITKTGLLLFVLLSFQFIGMRSQDILIRSKGYFKETVFPYTLEAVINFVVSLLLVKNYGISGVIFATLLSMVISRFILVPMFIFRKVYKSGLSLYYYENISSLIIVFIFIKIFDILSLNMDSILGFVLWVIVSAAIVFVLLYIIYMILFSSFRDINERVKFLIKNRGKRKGSKV